MIIMDAKELEQCSVCGKTAPRSEVSVLILCGKARFLWAVDRASTLPLKRRRFDPRQGHPATPPATRVRAAGSILDHTIKAIEIEGLEARLSGVSGVMSHNRTSGQPPERRPPGQNLNSGSTQLQGALACFRLSPNCLESIDPRPYAHACRRLDLPLPLN